MELIHLRNNEIDLDRWDAAISNAYNSLAYAYSWYLDVVSPNWEALVTSDYKYVMPLPVKTKYKIPYLVQPVLTQQLGVFSDHKITKVIIDTFIKEIPYYSYEINLNAENYSDKATPFPNLMLDLHNIYDNIRKLYSKNTNRNIEKAEKLNLHIQIGIPKNEFIDFYNETKKNYHFVKTELLEKLFDIGIENKQIEIVGAYSVENKLIAAGCFLISKERIINLLPVSNNEGKSSSAMFLLINALIRRNCEQQKLLDFEGSRIEGVARFYRGFGAENQPYYVLKRLRPSFIINKMQTK
jgi:hypothetical protein